MALEYGQAMTVRVCKADGEVMREFSWNSFFISIHLLILTGANLFTAIVVVQSATVLDLKKAICRYMELKQQREGGVKHISW